MVSVFFPLVPITDDDTGKTTFKDVEFRFTIRTTREMERSAGCGVQLLHARSQSVEALVLLLCYGLRWKDKKEDKAVDLIDTYLNAGGETEALSKALVKSLNESGVYGTPPEEREGDENPPKKAPATSETPTEA